MASVSASIGLLSDRLLSIYKAICVVCESTCSPSSPALINIKFAYLCLLSLIMFNQLPRKSDNKKAYDELKTSLYMFASLVATVRFIPYLLAGIQKASS